MYRTQINDRPGVLLRSLDFTGPELLGGGLLDTLHVDGSDLGAGPAGRFRFLAGQNERLQAFVHLARDRSLQRPPGVRQSLPRRRHHPGPADLEPHAQHLRRRARASPGQDVTPLLGYTRNVYDGPGTTTYHLGENEFQLDQQVHSVDELYRVGLGFHAGNIQAGFTQGWRVYTWQSVETLTPGAGSGNVTTPVLGQTTSASAVASTENDRVNTPVTNAWVSGTLFGRLKLIGTYIKADGSNETGYVEADAGKLRFLRDRPLLLGSRRDGGLAREDGLLARLRPRRAEPRLERRRAGGWVENHRFLDGQALISTLFLTRSPTPVRAPATC